MKFKSDIEIQAGVNAGGSTGESGQILSSTGTDGVAWINQNAIGASTDFVFFNVKNETGSTILKGKGIMAVGTDGNSGHILIDEMVADGTVESKYFLGVLEEDIANGAFARVISFGQLDQFNTSGQNGETWADGQVLWCDPVNPGDFTITEPDGPNVKIAAAFIVNSSTNGKIQVRVQANEGIHDLHDTKITSQVDGDVLVWDNTTGVWFNDSTLNVDYTNGRVGINETNPSTALFVNGEIRTNNQYSVINGTERLYLGVGYSGGGYLEYNNTFGNADTFKILVGGTIFTEFSKADWSDTGTNAVQISNADLSVGYDTLFVNNTTDRVGIGTLSPSEKLNVSGNILATGTILGSNLSGTNTGDQDLSGYALTSHTHTWADINGETANSVNGWGGLRHQTNDGYIDFGPANSSHAHIYTDRPNFYFNKALTVNGQSVINTGDIRSAIFYDLDNTGYYLNPASISVLDELNVKREQRWFRDASNNAHQRVDGRLDGSDQARLHWYGKDDSDNTRNFKHAWYDGSNYINVTAASSVVSFVNTSPGATSVSSDGDFRAPIFYDSNDTGYYLNPASTSRTNNITGNIFSGVISTSGDGQNNYPFRLNSDYSSYMVAAASNTWGLFWAGNSGARYGTNGLGGPGDIWGNSANPNEFVFVGADSTKWALYGNDGRSWQAGSGQSAVDFRAPIFYDSNNTSYYLNPASTSNLNAINLAGIPQTSPVRGQVYDADTHTYTNSTNYWTYIKVASVGASSRGFLKYHCKGDQNYPYNVSGIIGVSSHVSSSISISNTLLTPTTVIDPQVYIDNNNDIWLRMSGASWTNRFEWNWEYRSGITAYDGSTTSLTIANATLIPAGRSYKFNYVNSGAPAVTNEYAQVHYSGEYYAHNQVKAPIFYDLNNTSYYLNPASTSNLNNLTVNGTLTATASGNLPINGKAADSELIDGIDSSRIVYGSGSRRTNNQDPNTAFNSGFYDISGTNAPTNTWYSYLTMAHTNEGNMHGHQIAGSFYSDGDLFNRHYDGNGSFGNWTRIWNEANDGAGSGLDADTLDGQHASAFLTSYSETDTLDSVADRGRTTNQQLISTNPAGFRVDSGSYARIEIDSNNNWSYIRLQDNATVSWDIATFNGGQLELRPGGGSANRTYFDASGNSYSETSKRAPIFYDLNNTSYYLNPAGKSRLGNIERLSHSTGFLVGSYNSVAANSTKTNPIYTIGDSYKPTDDSLSSMYGIGYTYGTNAPFVSLSGAIGWGMYVASAGTARIFLDAQYGIVTSTGSSRAPIFSDSNNTAYYLDPSSTGISAKFAGSVAVGTTSPEGKLDVRSDSTFPNSAIVIPSTTNQNPVLAFYRPTGSGATSYPWHLEAVNSSFHIKTGSSANIGSESVSSKVTINSSGDVGIGTTSPQGKLEVQGSAPFIYITDDTETESGIIFRDLQAGLGQAAAIKFSSSDNKLRFYNNDTTAQRMVIDTSGNVGIGEASPDARLTVYRTDSTYAVNLSDAESRAGLSVKSSSSFDSKLTISSGASSRQYIQGVNNAATTGRDICINPFGGNVGFGTTSPAQKVQIHSGRLLVSNSTTPIYIKVNSSYKSWVHHIGGGSEYIFAPSTAAGGETWDWSNSVSFNTSGEITANNFILRSDETLKENVEDLNVKVDAKWKSYKLKGTEEIRYGVIAQELEETNPELVAEDDKGLKSVKYIDLLIAKIAELEARLEKLENNN